MKFLRTPSLWLSLFLMMNVGFAYDGFIRIGRLYVSKIENVETDEPLFIEGNTLKLSNSENTTKTLFDYGENGTLEIAGTNKYLAIDSEGKFTQVDNANAGFHLKTNPGFYFQRQLYYNEKSTFCLFEDDSVGIKKGSKESRDIEITYEDMIQPR